MKFYYCFLLCLIFLAACLPTTEGIVVTRGVQVTAVPLATPSPTPMPTVIPLSPTPPPTITPITNDVPFSYTSETGNFSIELPAKTTVYEELFPSIDGVFVETPDTTSFIRFEPNFALTIHWVMFKEQTSLDNFITAQSQCVDVSADDGETVTVDGYKARLYAPTACGPVETVYLYLVTPTQGYILTIRAMTPYRFLSDFIWEMLDTFTVQ